MARRTLRDSRMVMLGSRALDLLEECKLLTSCSSRKGHFVEQQWGKERLREALDRLDEFGGVHHGDASAVYAALLRQCANVKALSEGKRLHGYISRTWGDAETFWGNLVMQMYGKCGCPEEARWVFDKLHQPNEYSWTIMLTAYAQNGYLQDARDLFQRIPNPNVVAWTIMVAAYATNGSLLDARRMFEAMPDRTVISWNAVITAYTQRGHRKEALEMFCRMDQEGVKPNEITFISILDACGDPEALQMGRLVHQTIVDSDDHRFNVVVETALVNMYGKCGSVQDARWVFDKMPQRNLVSWTSIISAYAQNGHGKQALEMFRSMDVEGMKPNEITLLSIIDACASLGALSEGRIVHDSIADSGFVSDIKVGNALVNMYAKCGSVLDARGVFDRMKESNVVSWSALIAAYAQSTQPHEAFQLFQLMDLEGVTPNEVTFVGILDACANLAKLAEGRVVHASVVESGVELDVVVATALVNMYAKCGTLDDAWNVFCRMPQQDVILCNAIITAFAQNGHSQKALDIFRVKELEGMKPSRVTFIAVLTACAHAGFVKHGWQYFVSLNEDYGIVPNLFHYVCMIDLLGRAGLLNDAEDLINNMPLEPDLTAWLTLLAGCKSHADQARAECLARHILAINPQDPAPYILLSNIFAGDDNQQEFVSKLRNLKLPVDTTGADTLHQLMKTPHSNLFFQKFGR